MEGNGRLGSSSSSSFFIDQLFGPKEPSSSVNFNSIFSSPSKGTSRNILSFKNGSPDQSKESATFNLSSSLYYGGQDFYSQSTNNHTYPTVNKAQLRENDDVRGNNTLDASRGNWWQDSLYY